MLAPMQMVLLPHMPLVVTRRPSMAVGWGIVAVLEGGITTGGWEVVDGRGGMETVVGGGRETMVVEMTTAEVVEVVVGRGGAEVVGGGGAEVVVGGGGTEVVVGAGGAAVVAATRGHPHTPYAVWQPNRGAQWSTESPQKP